MCVDRVTKDPNLLTCVSSEDQDEIPFDAPLENAPEEDDGTSNAHDQGKATRTRDFLCGLCHKAFYTRAQLKSHIRTHTQEKVFACERCSFATTHSASLRLHRQIPHKGEPSPEEADLKYKCDKCEYRSLRYGQLAQHAKIHRERRFACIVEGCNFRSQFKGNVKNHQKSHKELPASLYSCGDCDFQTRYAACLRKHALVHSDDRPYACDSYYGKTKSGGSCDNRSKTLSDLKSHWNVVHSADRENKERITCPTSGCKYTTIYQKDMNRHVRTHIAKSERPFKCAFCDFRANSNTELRMHEMRRHKQGKGKTFTCSFCSKSFYTGNELRLHVQSHTGEKDLSCPYHPICSYRTQIGGNMQRHIRNRHPSGNNRKPLNYSSGPGSSTPVAQVKGRKGLTGLLHNNNNLQHKIKFCFVPLVRIRIPSEK